MDFFSDDNNIVRKDFLQYFNATINKISNIPNNHEIDSILSSKNCGNLYENFYDDFYTILNAVRNCRFIIDADLFNEMLRTIDHVFKEKLYVYRKIKTILLKKIVENPYLDSDILLRHFTDLKNYPPIITNDNMVSFEFKYLQQFFNQYGKQFIIFLQYIFLRFKNIGATNKKIDQISTNFTTDFFIKIIKNYINDKVVQNLLANRNFTYEEMNEIISACGLFYCSKEYYDIILNNPLLSDNQRNSMLTMLMLNNKGDLNNENPFDIYM